MADPRVETDGVTFCAVSLRRRGHVLLDELELTIEPGEILAVMGPSGAGKSTLLRTIAGLDPPSEGVIRRAPGRVAVVFQDPRLLPWRTALENVELVLAPGARPRARDWLARVGLAEAASVYPGALSGGMRQRVAIARALACETPIVLVDEPNCRGYRFCVEACPYKKLYFNPQLGVSQKCIMCFPRVEKGLPPACVAQ